MKAQEVAKTILEQLKAVPSHAGDRPITGKHTMMCWGFDKPCVSPECEKNGWGGLEFDVNGEIYQGKIRVMLHWSDTYTIFTHKNNEWIPVIDMVHMPELTTELDFIIEVAR